MSGFNPFGLTSRESAKDRIQLLDAVRGLSILLMLACHITFDLWLFGLIPSRALDTIAYDACQILSGGLFVLLSGVSSRFSRSNLRRGLRVLCWAMVVSLVSWAIGEPILFGVLHFLGCAMVLYGLLGRWLNRVPRKVLPFLCIAGAALTAPLLDMRFPVRGLFWLGFMSKTFESADYYPLLPWLFVFGLGTWIGGYIREHRLSQGFYAWTCPALPELGRRSLLIYLVHQPICFGLVALIAHLIGG